ncbi:MAG: hypothetical protein MRJ92_04130 [Nitrospira sp.]|nr:hypothetical protein [Nitrospira sp.]
MLQLLKMKDPAFLMLRQWAPDVIAVTAFGRDFTAGNFVAPAAWLYQRAWIVAAEVIVAGPVQWAIMRGERETGITTMYMAEGMDTGDMLLRETVKFLVRTTRRGRWRFV